MHTTHWEISHKGGLEELREDGDTQAGFEGNPQNFSTCVRELSTYQPDEWHIQSMIHEIAGNSGEKFSAATAVGEARDGDKSLKDPR